MPKRDFRGCFAKPFKIPRYEKFARRLSKHNKKKELFPSSSGVDPELWYIPTTEILEPPLAMMNSRACMFEVFSL